MKTDLTFLKPLVEQVLRRPFVDGEWTVQGFGFLRTYFGGPANPKQFRLNLWDSRFTVPNVSTIHTHPWDFTSVIVAGIFGNVRYEPTSLMMTHHVAQINCGIGGGMKEMTIFDRGLLAQRPELYGPGDMYSQKAHEIHETFFKDGSVTINERVGDTGIADVYWPYGTDWVDAIPRPATRDEVASAVGYSLEEWS
jgi:hypothetical protein